MENILYKGVGKHIIQADISSPVYDFGLLQHEVKEQMDKEIFTGLYNVSIIGVRTPRQDNRVSDRFQDYAYFTWEEPRGDDIVRVWFEIPITTLAGKKMYRHPLNSKGTAQMPAGFHKSIWERGKHKRSKPALVQTGAKVTVLRDNDGDKYHDWDVGTHRGWFGINFHTANAAGTSVIVGGWSAGCQVTNITQDAFEVILRHLKHCESKTGFFKYSYFLLDLAY